MTITQENNDKFKMVIIHLKNGENVIGPAIIHRPVGSSVDIEDWIYTDFVIVNKPLKVIVDLSTERCVLGIFKYNVMTDDIHCLIKTDAIESISYLNNQNIELYETAVKYFDTVILPKFSKEVDLYIQQMNTSLKKNIMKTEVSKHEDSVNTMDVIRMLTTGSNNTIH